MSSCDQYQVQILLYLDGELSGEEGVRFRKHLAVCDRCWKQIEEEQALSNLLHRSSPLYSAPDVLYTRVAAVRAKEAHAVTPAPEARANLILQPPLKPSQNIESPPLLWKSAIAAVLAITLGLTLVLLGIRHARATAYLDTAVMVHRNYLDGKLPLEIKSDSTERVAAWFSGKIPFRNPTSEILSTNHPAYRLLGARLVNYRSGSAALVVYEMKSEHISLLVTPEKSAVALGGDEVRSGDLTFHYHTKAGLNIIMWTTHGLTYALVSSIHTTPQQSCLICHQDEGNRNNFKERQ
jgi:anti-sigma factor RsiW